MDYAPPADAEELRRRAAVWAQLSDLFLDTEVKQPCIDAMVRAAKAGGYGEADLRAMLLYEVAPAVYGNIYSVIGEWVPFDAAWLSRRSQRNWRRPLHRWRCRLARRRMLGPIDEDLARLWQALASSP